MYVLYTCLNSDNYWMALNTNQLSILSTSWVFAVLSCVYNTISFHFGCWYMQCLSCQCAILSLSLYMEVCGCILYRHRTFTQPVNYIHVISLWLLLYNTWYYNENMWSLCRDHMNCGCVGIFHESTGWVKYSNQKQWTWSLQMISTNLFLFLCYTTIEIWCWF